MKRKRSSSTKSSQQAVSSDLPDECWELIFRFILKDENNLDYYSLYILNSLSLVSKQFLSITNTLRLSLSVPFSRGMIPIFKRFTDITSLKFDPFLYPDLDKILCKVSRFPLKKLTSLDISYQCTIPANGLRVFSQNIRTLTSLTCSDIDGFNTTDLFLIAECFPLLEELNLIFPSDWKSIYKNYNNYCDGIEALSLALVKLLKVKLCRFPMSDKSLFYLFNSCKLLEDVTLFECDQITIAGIASAIRERHILLYSIAREGLPLTRLALRYCLDYSYAGIFCLLSKCRGLQHMDLEHAIFLNDHYVDEFSLFIGDLVSVNLSQCLEITYSSLFALVRNCPSLSEIKMENIGSKSLDNSDSLPDFGVYPQLKSLYLAYNTWVRDEHIIMFSSIFPNLKLFDLNSCNHISEGICQVLRRCSNIRHLNLAHCSRVNLLEVNFVIPMLEVLNLSYTMVDDKTLCDLKVLLWTFETICEQL